MVSFFSCIDSFLACLMVMAYVSPIVVHETISTDSVKELDQRAGSNWS